MAGLSIGWENEEIESRCVIGQVIENRKQVSRWSWQSDDWDREKSLRPSAGKMENGRRWRQK